MKGLSTSLLTAWITFLEQARKEPDHIFYPFTVTVDRLANSSLFSLSEGVAAVHKDLEELAAESSLAHPKQKDRGDIVFEEFEKLNYEGWSVSGQAFGEDPVREIAPNQGIRGYQGQGIANSFRGGSDRLVGSLTSEKFKMPKLYVHVRLAGSKETVRVPTFAEGAIKTSELRFTVVANGHKSQHIVSEGGDGFQWKTVQMTKEIGRLCYFEIVDRSPEGHIAIDKIVLSDSEQPPNMVSKPNQRVMAMLGRPGLHSLESLAEAYQELFLSALRETAAQDQAARWLLADLNPSGKLEELAGILSADKLQQLGVFQARRASLETQIPESAFAMIGRDENPRNIRLHIRGNHKNLGEEVPRRFLQIVAGQDQMSMLQGSGRLRLAEWMASPENPLTARVMVNRIWQHHFGQGIVRSPDNFGKTGERPTHPELLDFLAQRFVENGWSVKAMHRLLLLSSAYGMSSQADKSASQIDPQNSLLHHMPVRRLEAEVIRDSILAVAGTLDRQLFGPSVVPFISQYQEGRGKPESGPLDGGRRRSIYIQVRRNFITPMFLAFDYPLPISTIGNRSVSTVPSQALMMMNNEFVTLESQAWARRLTSAEGDPRRCIEQLYLSVFGRPPEDWEIDEVLQFVRSQRSRYEALPEVARSGNLNDQAWADLCHVLLNSAEFIYVR